MIVRMSKYQFVLMSKECDTFVEQLRGLGMVDITTTGWQPSEADRSLMLKIEAHDKAIKYLERFIEEPIEISHFDEYALPFYTGSDAFESYSQIMAEITELDSQIAEIEKIKEESEPWGDFNSELLSTLNKEGLNLHYFVALESDYESIIAERGGDITIETISECDGKVYFLIITREGEEANIDIDAQIVRPLQYSAKEADAKIATINEKKISLAPILSRSAVSIEAMIENRYMLVEQMQSNKVSSTAEEAAEGKLIVLEGWAEESTSREVDMLLNSIAGVISIKSDPTPQDNTPVKLQNGRYARLFELVSNLYALPKYGTIDLTPFFAPFYMLFFAICLCDAGYGSIILLAGLGLLAKGGKKMHQAALFTICCGATAVVFGFFANSVFGMEFSSLEVFKNFKFIDFQLDFFSVSMIIGMVQILFGMLINIAVTIRSFSLKYALGLIGWFVMIFSAALSGALTSMGINGFAFDSVPFMVVEGIGMAMLLLLNSPGKNIFANIGAGLWETYDRTTGLLGDILSYIRLFAIGLSGGVLALVFNDLAVGMTGLNESWDGQSVVTLILKILAASTILLIGHGINFFMSTISSFVHPMRLTFVEFYKNAGFEMSTRTFAPIKKETKE